MFARMKDEHIGAVVVLEDYLDGAVHDYEEGRIEEDYVIMSCISALRLMNDSEWLDYYLRMEKAKERRGL